MKRSKRSRIRAAKPTAGAGHKKKNRGKGNRGGKGNAGRGKRNSQQLMKLTGGEKVLGKHGFKSKAVKQTSINLETIQLFMTSYLEKGYAVKTKEGYELDLEKLGYDKLLSKGKVTVKLVIKAKAATEKAKSRVEEAGGKVVLPE